MSKADGELKTKFVKSSWTPLRDPLLNSKVFEDRRTLIVSWVCWYWKYLADSNEIWAPKCLHRGWNLPCAVDGAAPGVWKRHYIQKIRYMQLTWPTKVAATRLLEKLEQVERVSRQELEWCRESARREKKTRSQQLHSEAEASQKQMQPNQPVWRGPDRYPMETRRMNYLDNDFDLLGNRDNKTRSSSICPLARVALENGIPRRPLTSADRMPPKILTPTDRTVSTIRVSNPPKINFMAVGPQVPWKPSSRFPQRKPLEAAEDLKWKYNSSPHTCRCQIQRHMQRDQVVYRASPEGAGAPTMREYLTDSEKYGSRNCLDMHHDGSERTLRDLNKLRTLSLPPTPQYSKQILQPPLGDMDEVATEQAVQYPPSMQSPSFGITQLGTTDETFHRSSRTPEPKPRRGPSREVAGNYESLREITVQGDTLANEEAANHSEVITRGTSDLRSSTNN
ncbi:unnamed protein product [Dicrocoelium dendriticum]|nr:unnamed protein product [Dicrocoelium dendriticum]CAH8652479.1 unnamed protein product [Dicrocoelium dendriticum]